MHGAGGNALAAADALGMLHGLLLVGAEGQHGAGALAHGDVSGVPFSYTHLKAQAEKAKAAAEAAKAEQ